MIDILLKTLHDKSKTSNPEFAVRYFKVGPGSYSEHDVFWGIPMPELRKICKKYVIRDFDEIDQLLDSEIHEIRMAGVVQLIDLSKKDYFEAMKRYLGHVGPGYCEKYKLKTRTFYGINNWDLVDVGCAKLVGLFWLKQQSTEIHDLGKYIKKNGNLWEKRVMVVSMLAFIRNQDLDAVYDIIDIYLDEKHDLMHKAVGWMLREAGKKDMDRLETYIRLNQDDLARTTLRYAIEKFAEPKRKELLSL